MVNSSNLGFDISERTVSRLLQRAPRKPEAALPWKTFLQNHREAIAAMDFFTVPTLTFGILFCFFVIAHDRRRILHFNVTKHPTDCWVCQQLRDAFPFNADYKYLIFDRDSKFGEQTSGTVNTIGLEPLLISFRSPWQNGVAERWVGTCRRDLLDHIVPINEPHLKRLLSEYLAYYHSDRTHLGLEKDTPFRPPTVSAKECEIVSSPRVGGLHHRYDRAA
jgi:putative transposase